MNQSRLLYLLISCGLLFVAAYLVLKYVVAPKNKIKNSKTITPNTELELQLPPMNMQSVDASDDDASSIISNFSDNNQLDEYIDTIPDTISEMQPEPQPMLEIPDDNVIEASQEIRTNISEPIPFEDDQFPELKKVVDLSLPNICTPAPKYNANPTSMFDVFSTSNNNNLRPSLFGTI